MGNILAEVFEIPCATHEIHHGVVESDACRNHRYWGNLEKTSDYIEFLRVFSASDFFKLAKGEPEYFLNHRSKNFFEFLFELMDGLARKSQSKSYWATKLDPLFFVYPDDLEKFLDSIQARYQQAKFISVQRNFDDYLRSYEKMAGSSFKARQRLKLFATILGAARYNVYYDQISKVSPRLNCLTLKYEDLKNDFAGQIAKISQHLAIEPVAENTKSKPNTSFVNNQPERSERPIQTLIAKCICKLPFASRYIVRYYNDLKKQKNPAEYRLIMSQYFPDQLLEELKAAGETRIAELVAESNK